MKIAIIGATGWIGSTIANEALGREHEVISIARDISKITLENVDKRELDILKSSDLASAVQGADVVIAAVGGRAKGNHDMVASSAERLLVDLPQTDASRLLWVGGAGSLEVAPGVTVLSTPDFPEEYKDEAKAQTDALGVFRSSKSAVEWTFISPAAEILPGTRSGSYRVGGDQLLMNDDGESRISVEDYAVAVIDEAEKRQYPNQRIGVAY